MQLTIKNTEIGPVTVNAKKIGPLAVHHRILSNDAVEGGIWSITHIETGYLVLESDNRVLAVRCAYWLSSLDWDGIIRASQDFLKTGDRRKIREYKTAMIRVMGLNFDAEQVWFPSREYDQVDRDLFSSVQAGK